MAHEYCKNSLKYIKEPVCDKCGVHIENDLDGLCESCMQSDPLWDMGRCLFYYSGSVRNMVLSIKKSGIIEPVEFCAIELYIHFRDFLSSISDPVLVPVPCTEKKKRIRGYNQAELLAKELSRISRIPMKRLLKKVRNTKDQKKLNREGRIKNLRAAFAMSYEELGAGSDGNIILPESVIIIDDISTTGSTINECTKVLKASGIKKVFFLCVCHEGI